MTSEAPTSGAVPVRPASPSSFLSTGQVARRLGYSRKQVWRWCVDGKIPAVQFGDGSEWRIPLWWVAERLAKTAPIKR